MDRVPESTITEDEFSKPVQEAVDEWLDEHPEATTTVQDGTLTEAKFSDALKLATVKDYVTPEMFSGTDDEKIASAIATGKRVVCNGAYSTTGTITLPAGTDIEINGTITYTGDDAAVDIGGNNIRVSGVGGIDSGGVYVFRINDVACYDTEISLLGKCRCITSGGAYLYIYAKSNYTTRLHTRNINFVGGTGGVKYANGIVIETAGSGYVNENVFDTSNFNLCVNAIKMVNGSSKKINGNHFLAVEGENATVNLYAHGSAVGAYANEFHFRTNEWGKTEKRIDVDSLFTKNKIYVTDGLCPENITDSVGASPAFYNKVTMPEFNSVFGTIINNSSTVVAVNADFFLNGNQPVFSYDSRQAVSAYVNSSPFTMTYSNTHTLFPGKNVYRVSGSVTALVIDLNNVVNWCCNPLKLINFPVACTLKIVNGDTVLFAEKSLEAGLYRCVYLSETAIGMYKIG